MIAQFAQAHQLISDGLGLTPLDEMNERLYSDDRMKRFRVPVAITRRGVVEILARDAESARNVVGVCTALADGLENAEQSEEIGPATAI
ncbi:MAG: hypothetical protein KF688_03840 [Pirellulales bacterium]|nr:hypothetical protein [Pirellulales bacterium]